MKLRTIRGMDPQGKKILLRLDLNVPLSGGKVADDSRIRAVLPTLRWLLERGARVALLSHLDRPEGKVVEELRLKPVAERLGKLLGRSVPCLSDCIGPEVRKAVDALQDGEVLMLENVRFYPGEEENDPQFARELAKPFEVFVNDAFATAHRAHASTVGVAQYLPAYAGFLMEREVQVLSGLLENPRRPFYVLVGGKKAKDKLGVLTGLLPLVDGFLIGGGVAFTFLAAQGLKVGRSVVDEKLLPTIQELIHEIQAKGKELHLPVDVVVAPELREHVEIKVISVQAIPEDWMGLDIGPATVGRFAEVIERAGTVVWTGPMGAFEVPPFGKGTEAIARALISSKAFTVVGGGETGEAVEKLGLAEKFGYVSTGGGATLSFLLGEPMPALEVLRGE
ncbi:MAG: phosphoglycerate kinase [Candidatus Bipolaricaulaceae bacterium]